MNSSHQPPDSFELSELKNRVSALEREIAVIRERNSRVENNKAWETGRARLLSITLITYVTMVLVFRVLGSGRPLAEALVPTTGFFLSTLSLSFLRGIWQRRMKRMP